MAKLVHNRLKIAWISPGYRLAVWPSQALWKWCPFTRGGNERKLHLLAICPLPFILFLKSSPALHQVASRSPVAEHNWTNWWCALRTQATAGDQVNLHSSKSQNLAVNWQPWLVSNGDPWRPSFRSTDSKAPKSNRWDATSSDLLEGFSMHFHLKR